MPEIALKKQILAEVLGTESTVNKAIENLDKFALVGCLEYLDAFQKQIEKRYGASIHITRKNPNPLSESKQIDQITKEIRKKVETLCEPDLALYNAAISRLDKPLN